MPLHNIKVDVERVHLYSMRCMTSIACYGFENADLDINMENNAAVLHNIVIFAVGSLMF